LIGLLSLRRAYAGEKRSAIITLSHATGGRMTRRGRLMQIVAGSLFLASAVVWLVIGLRQR
jgi:hypothetical protein